VISVVEKLLEGLKRELAATILAEIVQTLGEQATLGKVRSRYRISADEIQTKVNINILNYFEETIQEFSANTKKGIIRVPKKKFRSKNSIIKEITKVIEPSRAAKGVIKLDQFVQALPEFKASLEVREMMATPDEYLAKWNSSTDEVLQELQKFSPRKYDPTTYEFLLATTFAIIFQLPLYSEYGAEFDPEHQSGIVWRGRFGKSAEDFAPGGMSDVIAYTRSEHFVLGEATLRFTRTQWETEIEPIFTHVSEVCKEHNISKDRVYLVFTAPELLDMTYERLKTVTRLYNVLYLDAKDFFMIASISNYIPGLSNHEVIKLFNTLNKTLNESRSFGSFKNNQKGEISRWRSNVAEAFLNTFMAVKIYEKLAKRSDLVGFGELTDWLVKDNDVVQYYGIMAVTSEEIKSAVRDELGRFVGYGSILGLVKQVNQHAQALPINGYENTLYKMLGHLKKLLS
jgi:hypothetical protein